MGVTLVSDMIADAAMMMGDPTMARMTQEQWLLIYNLSVREMCTRFRILKLEWKDDLTTNHFCTYPDDMKVLTGVRVCSDANDLSTYQWVHEIKNEDEFRNLTQRSWPVEDLPKRYYGDAEVIYLVGRPSQTISDGIRLYGFGLPLRVTNLASAVYEPPDITRDLAMQRMVLHGQWINKQYSEANAGFQVWLEQGARFAQEIEDRSDDAKTSLRPAGSAHLYDDMR